MVDVRGYTEKEAAGYRRCTSKLKPGDYVELYIDAYGRPSAMRRTAVTRSAKVIGMRSSIDRTLLLGSHTINSFWNKKHSQYELFDLIDKTDDYDSFTHVYWAYHGDVLYAKIIKAK